ncbi:MAG: hypothetical protein QOH05_4036 [Acetobacteraceae bacterium]|jgi:hypothetical protein|nr:hypothetical protein [Acetobacteraceae bacterium]
MTELDPVPHDLRRVLDLAVLGIAIASILAGAAISVLPALVIGMVDLFYNSAGGVLILLGSLANLLPHVAVSGAGGSGLPVFQTLGTNTAVVLLRSATGTVLCSIAAAMILASSPDRSHRSWLTIGLCCLAAAIVGGSAVAWALVPALAVSAFRLAYARR